MKPGKSMLLVIMCLVVSMPSMAQLSGSLSGTLGPGSYTVIGNISVWSGNTLTLSPGTTFNFVGLYSFTIYGTLLAEGTESQLIIFTASNRWRGLFFNSGSSGSLAYCLIERGYAAGGGLLNSGGGVQCYRSSPSFTNCTISGNSATEMGGGVFCRYASPTFTYCQFSGNSAASGGGVWCGYAPAPIFMYCTFSDNAANYYGGGVLCASSVNFTNSTISGNTAGRAGGGVYCTGSSPTFTNCTLSGNSASSWGGGVYCYQSSPTFTGCTVSGNTAQSYSGGGVCCDNSSPSFTNSTINGNTANYGAGVDCLFSWPTFTNCALRGNSAGQYGGGVYCHDNSSPSFMWCTLSGNSGGGVYCRDSSPTFNSTIIAFSNGSGIDFFGGGSSQIGYCDLFGNSGGNFSGSVPPGLGQITTVNANGDPCDQYQNIFLDPQFVNVGGGDYHLSDASRCISAADPGSAPSTDIEGNPCPNPPGSRPDIGAYENPHYAPRRVITISQPNGGEMWGIGSSATVMWTSANLPENVKIELNRWYPGPAWETITDNTANTGSYAWTVSGPPTTTARVLITGVTYTTLGDTSDSNFFIVMPSVTVTSPNGGELWPAGQTHNITWTWTGTTLNVKIDLYKGNPPNGAFLRAISASTPNDGVYEWLIPVNLDPTQDYYVRVSDLDDDPDDFSDAAFTIGRPNITDSLKVFVMDPNGNPLEGAKVSLYGTSSNGVISELVHTNAVGESDFTDLLAARATLTATNPRYAPWYQEALTGQMRIMRIEAQLEPVTHAVTIRSLGVFQTVEQDLQPLIAGKKCVIVARFANSYYADVEFTCRLHVYNGQNEVEGFPIDRLFAAKRSGYSHSPEEHENWQDGLYIVGIQPPIAGDEEFILTFRAEVLNPDNSVQASETKECRFRNSRLLRLLFVPISTGDLTADLSACRTVFRAVQARITDIVPSTMEFTSYALVEDPSLFITVPDPASDLNMQEKLADKIYHYALHHPDRSTYFIGLFPGNEIHITPSTTRKGFSGNKWTGALPDICNECARTLVVCMPSSEQERPDMATRVLHELGHSLGDLLDCDQSVFFPDCRLDVWGLRADDNQTPGCNKDTRGIPSGTLARTDVMQAGTCNDWVRSSPTYQALRAHLMSTGFLAESQVRSEVGSCSYLHGIVGRDSTAPVFEAESLEGEYTPVEPDSGAWRLDWWDEQGTGLLKRLWFDPVFERREGLLDYANFFIVTSRPENGAIVTLNVGDHEVARITQSGHAPTVQLLLPNSGTLGDSAIVTWTAGDLDGDSLRYDVYANRDGGNWEPLAMDLSDTFFVWHTNFFPGTNAGRVKVVVTDGWNNAADSSNGTFTVLMHVPEVYIESPRDTAMMLSSSYITLSGRASDLEDGNIGYDSLAWYADANFLGTGSMIQASNLATGLRTIMLMATDSDGQTGSAQTYVNVLADDDHDNMSDAWEITHGLDTTVNDGYGDLDRDDLTNLREYQIGTWPDSVDTDHDTYADGYEVSQGSDPKNAASIPGTPMISLPTPITPIGAIPYGQQIIFSWAASTAADSLQPLRYEVNFDPDSSFSNPIALYADTVTSTACPYDLAAGLPYHWKVKASDSYGHWIWSAKASFTRGYNPIMPERVESLVVRVLDDGLHLYWNPVTRDTSGNPLTGIQYVVYAAPAVNDRYQPIAYTSQTEWTDTEVYSLQWTKWFYRVRALGEGNPPALISRRNWMRSVNK